MPNIKTIDTAGAASKTRQIFDAFQKNLGTVPNLLRALAHSPAALNAYVGFNSALGEGQLPAALREQIAIAVANANACDYCLSAHTALGKRAGLTPQDLDLARNAEAPDSKTAAALQFAVDVVRKRALLPATDVERLRQAGYSDGEIVEIVAVIAINIFTNYFNHLAGTEIDFPIVRAAAR